MITSWQERFLMRTKALGLLSWLIIGIVAVLYGCVKFYLVTDQLAIKRLLNGFFHHSYGWLKNHIHDL